jgi:HK97 family phage major capsid protein
MDLGKLAEQFEVGITELKDALNGNTEKLRKLDERLMSAEAETVALSQTLARGPPGGNFRQSADTGWGHAVVNSPELQAFAAKPGRGKVQIEVKALTSDSGSAGALAPADRQTDAVMLPRQPTRIRSLLSARPTQAGVIEYPRQDARDLNAASVSEGTLKPESTMSFEMVTASVTTIAHWTKASKQILADAPQLQALIDGELRYGLELEEEAQILLGDGSGTQLEGIIPLATAFSETFQPEMMQRIDTLRLAMLQARLALYPVTGFVLHPTDWARIETTKDQEGRYVVGAPKDGTTPTLWGVPVVESDSITAGHFLTGAFGLGAQLYDREQASVMISTEDGDNFRYNMVTILAEERVALTVSRPSAFVYGAFQVTT